MSVGVFKWPLNDQRNENHSKYCEHNCQPEVQMERGKCRQCFILVWFVLINVRFLEQNAKLKLLKWRWEIHYCGPSSRNRQRSYHNVSFLRINHDSYQVISSPFMQLELQAHVIRTLLTISPIIPFHCPEADLFFAPYLPSLTRWISSNYKSRVTTHMRL